MDNLFDFSLQRDTLYEQIAERIVELIVSAALHPGDKLPGERELAEQLGVSRPVIRDATRILSVRGLVEVRPGSGTYIQELDPRQATAPIELYLRLRRAHNTFNQIYEIRHTLEVEIAGLAAERATEEDLAALEAAIDGMAANSEDSQLFTHYDLAFHSALGNATHNDLYNVLLTPITDLLLDYRLAAFYYDPEETIHTGLTGHREILDAVRSRDPRGARQAMLHHLKKAKGLYEAAHKKAHSD